MKKQSEKYTHEHKWNKLQINRILLLFSFCFFFVCNVAKKKKIIIKVKIVDLFCFQCERISALVTVIVNSGGGCYPVVTHRAAAIANASLTVAGNVKERGF